MQQPYDAILVVSFGGPEGKQDVLPFLENVVRGRNVPRQRLVEVAEHYYAYGGVSPLNGQIRKLIAALRPELDAHGIRLPIFWGNRNWQPLLRNTMREMADSNVRRALALVTSAYSSYSSCRQYQENIEQARRAVGPQAPHVDRVRAFYNHPEFIAASRECVGEALSQIAPERRQAAHIAYTAHSIPSAMAATCEYEQQLQETCRLVSKALDVDPDRWRLVYQSRSGRPTDPWLEPDICDHLAALHKAAVADVVVVPIGFLSDHMEVLFDLDEEAGQLCTKLGMNMVRASTVGTHPRFVGMLRELIQERLVEGTTRRAVGCYGPSHDVCPADCCPARAGAVRPATETPG